VRGAKDRADVLVTAINIARASARCGRGRRCYGFVGNRMLRRAASSPIKLLLEGALPQEVDAVVTKFGFPDGPFAMGDLAGLDVGWRIAQGRGSASRSRGRAVRGRTLRPEDRQGLLQV
jgi:3-hydroxyacyl-CoA dehydrogenase